MLNLIRDKERTSGVRVTHPQAIHLIEDRMGLFLKPTFVSRLWKEEARYLEVRNKYDDGLRRNVKDRL